MESLKILHTADWHLGRTLYGKRRYQECDDFLKWLLNLIKKESIDILLIAGDIFDTTTPGNTSQNLYYDFLADCSRHCAHIIVIAGNHDSQSLLDAPKALLKSLHVHVIGRISENIEEELISLYDAQNRPQAIICAVPFLREKDVRSVDEHESGLDKTQKVAQAIKEHYDQIYALAREKQAFYNTQGHTHVPIIAMGHLFVAGGHTSDGDGVRDLYVGTLGQVGAEIFPEFCDYVALGHLHSPQCVNKNPAIRYSGSPIPMGFGEARQQKKVVIVHCADGQKDIKEHDIPCFQNLVSVVGSLSEIQAKIADLKKDKIAAWLEIECTQEDAVDIVETLNNATSSSQLEVLRIKKVQSSLGRLSRPEDMRSLKELTPEDVFESLLERKEWDQKQKEDLRLLYKEVLHEMATEDSHEEGPVGA